MPFWSYFEVCTPIHLSHINYDFLIKIIFTTYGKPGRWNDIIFALP